MAVEIPDCEVEIGRLGPQSVDIACQQQASDRPARHSGALRQYFLLDRFYAGFLPKCPWKHLLAAVLSIDLEERRSSIQTRCGQVLTGCLERTAENDMESMMTLQQNCWYGFF